MKVSVAMITYNHEKFIAQAIDSVLMQQTDFEYELVIGEDCSTDRTRSMVVDYAGRYPDRIRPLLRERNLGMNPNFVQTFQSCRGEYVALLEGDDYWTDPLKLQKQIDFLDNHPECTICFHAVKIVWDDGSREPKPDFPPGRKQIYGLEDLLRFTNHSMKTCSVMFCGGLYPEFPTWYYEMPMGDLPLHILNAHYGNIGYINEILGVYRVHKGGVWFETDETEDLKRLIESWTIIEQNLDSKYRRFCQATIRELSNSLLRCYLARGDHANAKLNARKGIIGYYYSQNRSLGGFCRMLLNMYTPTLYEYLKNVRRFGQTH